MTPLEALRVLAECPCPPNMRVCMTLDAPRGRKSVAWCPLCGCLHDGGQRVVPSVQKLAVDALNEQDDAARADRAARRPGRRVRR